MEDTRDLFISYSNANLQKVEKIVSAIKFYGATCWFQMRDSKQNYVEEINRAINNSSNFVIFLSNESINSLMVRNEITRAIHQQRKNSSFDIVPVVIGDIDADNLDIIDLLLGSINWLYEDKYDNYESLALAIFEQANLTPHREASTQSIYSTEKEVERIRLSEQNKFYYRYAKQYLDDVFAKYDNPYVLDIGCDNGANIMMRLEGRNYGYLLGVDKEQTTVAEANANYGSDKASFVVCDVTSEQFFRVIFSEMQRIGTFGFDIIHISAVLLHLPKVEDLLKNLYMILKQGGTIFIQDEDDGVNLAYPYSKFFDDVFYVWEHSYESGDRKMGRKLPLLLKSAGFSQIKLLSATMTSEDFDGKYKNELWDLYFNPELWSADSAAYFDNYEAFSLLSGIFQKHTEMKQAYLDGKYFVMLGVLFYTAVKQ